MLLVYIHIVVKTLFRLLDPYAIHSTGAIGLSHPGCVISQTIRDSETNYERKSGTSQRIALVIFRQF